MTTKLSGLTFKFHQHLLKFKFEAGTSRGALTEKTSFFLEVYELGNEKTIGWGEAAPLPKLSLDQEEDVKVELTRLCHAFDGLELQKSEKAILSWVNENIAEQYPSIRFAFETAFLDLLHGGTKKIFDNAFYDLGSPIPINGLIWMGKKEFMLEQIDKKLAEGFDCIKMKIGAIDFDQECGLLAYIRKQFSADQVTIRVDANGAFKAGEAIDKLRRLSEFALHSIEQPIQKDQEDAMRNLCEVTPLPIALDEELIGIHGFDSKKVLLEKIRPQYIILKPTLLGGIQSCREWIEIAESLGIGWWMTSALESNIGLNAIAQFTATYEVNLPQGLGTGQLYHNNIASPLTIHNGEIFYDKDKCWGK
jgi:o-succinylbenzoate synthase